MDILVNEPNAFSSISNEINPFHLQLIHPATLHKFNAPFCADVQGTAMTVLICPKLCQDTRGECCKAPNKHVSCI